MTINESLNDVFYQSVSVYNKILTSNKISILIPMYNEEKSIENVLSKIPKLPNYEIIIVDDGSTDNSKKIVQRFDNVRLFIHEKNMGYGQAILDGFNYSTGDIIITLDSDGQHEPRDIFNLIKPIIENNADIVIGSRYMGKYSYHLPFSTRTGEAFIELMLLSLFGAKIKNNQNGFRAFRRKTIRPLFEDTQFNGFAFATETIIKAKLRKYNIQEAPIHLYNREYGRSRINLGKLLFSLLHCLFHYSIIRFFGQKSLDSIYRIIKKLSFLKIYS